MAKIIHAYGKAITLSDKANHPYLNNKMWNHTHCGYLFDNTEENRQRISIDNSEVTCKLCLKQLNKL